MSAPNFMAIHPIVFEIIYWKPKISTSRWHQRKSQGIPKLIRIHPLGTTTVCTKFCTNPSCRCWDISLDKWKPAGEAGGKVRGSLKSGWYILWGPFHGNTSNSCWDISLWIKVADWTTNISIPRAMALAWLKISVYMTWRNRLRHIMN